jgi:hypothetical protein
MVVNVCLAGIVCLLAMKLYGVWNNTYTLSTTLANEATVKAHNPGLQAHVKAKKPNEYYDVIVDKNLFSKSRSLNDGTEPLIPPSQMALHGCFIFGEYKSALLEVREQKKKKMRRGRTNRAPNNRKSREVTVGDMIAGYQVAKILEEKVLLRDEAGKTCIVQIETPENRSHVRTSVSKAHKTRRIPRRRSSRRTSRSRRTRR